MENRSDEYNIGIDLGTHKVSVSVFANNRIQTIPIDNGTKILPSYVYLGEECNNIGRVAKLKQMAEPKSVIYGMKRMLGHLYSDPEFQEDIKQYPFPIEKTDKDGILIRNEKNGVALTPVELTASLIYQAVQAASTYLNGTIKDAVITVPAYFNNVQRNDTINAGIIAGLERVHLVSEPTAAAISYGLVNSKRLEKVLVFDLGGGSLDVSVIGIMNKSYTVCSCSGDSHFGGNDITDALTKDIAREFNAAHGVVIEDSKVDYMLLRENVEEAKIALSSVETYDIDIEQLMGVEFHRTVTRTYLESLNHQFFKKCMEKVDDALVKSDSKKEDITHVILVGGSSAIPCIHERISAMFGKEKVWASVNNSDVVSRGAAVIAGVARDVTEKSFNFNVDIYTTTINYGNTTSAMTQLAVNDITPMNLGIRVSNGQLSSIIPAQSPIPCVRRKQYQAHKENQKTMRFKIYQGTDPMADKCKLISEIVVVLDQPGKISDSIVEVEFNLDSNSTLYVTATVQRTAKEYQKVLDMGSQVLTEDTVMNMKESLHESMRVSAMVEKRTVAQNNLQRNLLQSQIQLEMCTDETRSKQIQETVDRIERWLEQNSRASAEEYEEKSMILHSSMFL